MDHKVTVYEVDIYKALKNLRVRAFNYEQTIAYELAGLAGVDHIPFVDLSIDRTFDAIHTKLGTNIVATTEDIQSSVYRFTFYYENATKNQTLANPRGNVNLFRGLAQRAKQLLDAYRAKRKARHDK